MSETPSEAFAKARQSVYLSRAQLAHALHCYIDMIDDQAWRENIQKKINASFDNEVRAFSSVRDAIVLNTFRNIFRSPDLVTEYIENLIREEADADMRKLRVGIFQAVASVH